MRLTKMLMLGLRLMRASALEMPHYYPPENQPSQRQRATPQLDAWFKPSIKRPGIFNATIIHVHNMPGKSNGRNLLSATDNDKHSDMQLQWEAATSNHGTGNNSNGDNNSNFATLCKEPAEPSGTISKHACTPHNMQANGGKPEYVSPPPGMQAKEGTTKCSHGTDDNNNNNYTDNRVTGNIKPAGAGKAEQGNIGHREVTSLAGTITYSCGLEQKNPRRKLTCDNMDRGFWGTNHTGSRIQALLEADCMEAKFQAKRIKHIYIHHQDNVHHHSTEETRGWNVTIKH